MIFSQQMDAEPAIRPVIALLLSILVISSATEAFPQKPGVAPRGPVSWIPRNVLLRLVRGEDERRWDEEVSSLLSDSSPSVRERAALAAGRIGDERAVPALISLLQNDKHESVRAMAAFALGETDSTGAAEPLIVELSGATGELRARIVEALGKIAAALPREDEARRRTLGEALLSLLNSELQSSSRANQRTLTLALTAVLRARPDGAGKSVAQFLVHSDPRVRADAANALARLRAKDGNEQLRKLLISDPDPIVRANAARVLGATEDKEAFDALLDRALNDADSRVRVSSIRALALLRESKATMPLIERGDYLKAQQETNELLEIATTLGRIQQNTHSQKTITWLRQLQPSSAPEVEIALARIGPQLYLSDLQQLSGVTDWRQFAAMAQGAAELANVKTDSILLDASIKSEAIRNLTLHLSCPPLETPRAVAPVRVRPGMVLTIRCTPLPTKAVPDWLRAFAAFKTPESAETLRKYLEAKDEIVRATAAELLGELPTDGLNTLALTKALPVSLKDQQNDATLAILDSLAKQKSAPANEAIKLAWGSPDYLTRRSAAALLKANGAGDFSARIGSVQTRNTQNDYERAISRMGRIVGAVVSTTKGAFTIELLPEDAPLNVDNFVELAKRGYFNGISFHRVVSNFVIQGGDPRGDGNGGPGYSIRCEINQVPYSRGTVGMALSGKDTGGSQWFVTHSPQPHLDGGYTVFGRVTSGMDVVDRITRGDVIRSVAIDEGRRRASRP